jgi:hypothetical protein
LFTGLIVYWPVRGDARIFIIKITNHVAEMKILIHVHGTFNSSNYWQGAPVTLFAEDRDPIFSDGMSENPRIMLPGRGAFVSDARPV